MDARRHGLATGGAMKAARFAHKVARHWERCLPGVPMPQSWRRAAVVSFLLNPTLVRSPHFVSTVCAALAIVRYPAHRDPRFYPVWVACYVVPSTHGLHVSRRRVSK